MATPAQVAANRRNAEHSTGPVTEAGRQRSARNSVTHGLTSRGGHLPNEDPEEVEALRAGLIAMYQPKGILELLLIEEIVNFTRLIQRAFRVEQGALRLVITHKRGGSDGGAPDLDGSTVRPILDPDDEVGAAFLQLDEHGFLTKRLPRYMAASVHGRARAVAELRRQQDARRRTEREDPPADSLDAAAAPDEVEMVDTPCIEYAAGVDSTPPSAACLTDQPETALDENYETKPIARGTPNPSDVEPALDAEAPEADICQTNATPPGDPDVTP